MMWAIHVRNAVTPPGNLVASIIALNVREGRHIARISSVSGAALKCATKEEGGGGRLIYNKTPNVDKTKNQ
jgi:hypothetical protein